MKRRFLFKAWLLFLPALFILYLTSGSCRGDAGTDGERTRLREKIDSAVKLQHEAGDKNAAMRLFSEVAATYHPGMSREEKALVVESLNRMWYVYYFELFDYADATDCLERGLDICATDSIESSRLYLNRGVTYSLLTIRQVNPSDKIFELADRNLREAHSRAVAAGNVNVADYALLNLIVLYDKAEKPVDSLYPLLSQSVSLHTDPSDPDLTFSRALIGMVRGFRAADYPRIIEIADSLLAKGEFSPEAIRNKYQILLYKARALSDNGQPAQALDLLDTIKREADSLDLADVLMPVFELRAKAWAQQGKPLQEALSKIDYYEQRDAQLSEETLMAVNELPLIHDIRESRDALARENHHRRMITIYALNITVILLLLIIFSILLVRKNRELKTANSVLFRRNEEQLAEYSYGSLAGKPVSKAHSGTPDAASTDPDSREMAELRVIFDRLNELMERDRIWSDPTLTISRLAVEMKFGEKALSKAINRFGGMNFSAFINKRRVLEASAMLGNDKEFGHLSLQGIAETVGFKSRTTFIAAFKQFVGMLPSAYRKIALEKDRIAAQ